MLNRICLYIRETNMTKTISDGTLSDERVFVFQYVGSCPGTLTSHGKFRRVI